MDVKMYNKSYMARTDLEVSPDTQIRLSLYSQVMPVVQYTCSI